jgi:hypothetical protein
MRPILVDQEGTVLIGVGEPHLLRPAPGIEIISTHRYIHVSERDGVLIVGGPLVIGGLMYGDGAPQTAVLAPLVEGGQGRCGRRLAAPWRRVGLALRWVRRWWRHLVLAVPAAAGIGAGLGYALAGAAWACGRALP